MSDGEKMIWAVAFVGSYEKMKEWQNSTDCTLGDGDGKEIQRMCQAALHPVEDAMDAVLAARLMALPNNERMEDDDPVARTFVSPGWDVTMAMLRAMLGTVEG